MKTRWQSYHHDGVDYYKFSIYHFGKNMQTVYVFRMGDLLVDTGQGKSKKNVAASLAGQQINTLLITHHHEDHTGNASWIQDKYHCSVFAHPLGVSILSKGMKVSPIGRLITGNVKKVFAESLRDGQILEHGDYEIESIFTPGHTKDHVAYYVRNKGWLFSGDLYVADRIKYFESSESVGLQIKSLQKMVSRDFECLFCSHNPKVVHGKDRLKSKLQWMEDFYGDVAAQYHEGKSATEIFKASGRVENEFYRFLTMGHYSSLNMVKSVIKDVQNDLRFDESL